MNAMAVPPSGWNTLEAPEPVRGTSRQNVSRGLAISALVHLSALACILWVQAQRAGEEIILTSGQVHVLPPTIDHVPPPEMPGSWITQPKRGIYMPTRKVDAPDIVLPKIDVPTGIPRSGEPQGSGPSTGNDGPEHAAAMIDTDPREDAFIAFDKPPEAIAKPDPVYPEWARENGIEGRVVLHALVGTDGRVRRVTVRRGIPGLSESAEEALYRWTFRPAMAGRQPVAVWIEVPFRFHL